MLFNNKYASDKSIINLHSITNFQKFFKNKKGDYMPSNCVNCGAVLHGNICEYCGTEYNNNCIYAKFNERDYIGK